MSRWVIVWVREWHFFARLLQKVLFFFFYNCVEAAYKYKLSIKEKKKVGTLLLLSDLEINRLFLCTRNIYFEIRNWFFPCGWKSTFQVSVSINPIDKYMTKNLNYIQKFTKSSSSSSSSSSSRDNSTDFLLSLSLSLSLSSSVPIGHRSW